MVPEGLDMQNNKWNEGFGPVVVLEYGEHGIVVLLYIRVFLFDFIWKLLQAFSQC